MMRLLKLHLSAFGKFKDKTIEFKDGLNVIEGLNESGKSTIHAFIEGMLFGFIKPGQKRRLFFETLKRYQPKDTDLYFGSMVFELENTVYRLERDFHPRKGYVKLFHEKTGKEITDTFDVDPVTRQIDIAALTDMPYSLYLNTLSIREMDKKPDDTSENTLVERLQNLSATASEGLSTKKALAKLEERIGEIGSERARTRPYFQTLETLESLKEEKEEALKHHDALLALKVAIDNEKADLDTAYQKRQTLKTTIEHQKNTKKIKTHAAIEKHWLEAKNLLDETSETPVNLTPVFWFETFKQYTHLFKDLDEIRDTILSRQHRIDTFNEQIEAEDATLSERKFEEIKDDKERLETYQNQIDTDKLGALTQAAQAFETDKKNVESQLRRATSVLKYHLPLTVVVLGILAGLVVFLFEEPNRFYVFGLLTLPLAVGFYYRLKQKRLSKRLVIETGKCDNVKKSLARQEKTHKQAQAEIARLLGEYGLDKIDAFTQTYYEAKAKYENMLRLDAWSKRVAGEKEKLLANYQTIKPLLNRFNLKKTPESLTLLLSLRDIHNKITQLLNHQAYHDFIKTFDTTLPYVDPDNLDENERLLDEMNETIRKAERHIGEKTASLKEKAKATRDIALIEHDIAAASSKLKTLKATKAKYEKAKALIMDATDTLEENFAPVLSENIQAVLPRLTRDTYREIKIRRTLDFTVEVPHTKTLESPLFFSKGTLDQIYFAVRLGILKTLDKAKMPLFLDDAFVNFDDERIKAALRLVADLAANQQILLFTCHNREKAMLEAEKHTFNYMEL